MSDDETRAWYGSPYEPPVPEPEPPPSATAEGGVTPTSFSEWVKARRKVVDVGTREGDALVMGRFLPLHSGHLHLFTRAMAAVKGKVQFAISSHVDDFIDVSTRRVALMSAVPNERRGMMLEAKNIGSRGVPDGDAFWAPWVSWVQSQRELAACKVLVSGQPEAARFAELLKLEFLHVPREEVAVSGTAVRRAPWKWWDDIAPNMRSLFTSSVALVGPEGAGKSTLAKKLGDHFKTSVAHEYALNWTRGTGVAIPNRTQLAGELWAGQRQAWTLARDRAFRFFVADTDQLTLALWARRLFGDPLKLEPQRPGFTLLLDDATPWYGPKDRDEPEARKQMVTEFRRLLTGRGWPFVVIDGPREGRFDQAVERIEQWIRSNPQER